MITRNNVSVPRLLAEIVAVWGTVKGNAPPKYKADVVILLLTGLLV